MLSSVLQRVFISPSMLANYWEKAAKKDFDKCPKAKNYDDMCMSPFWALCPTCGAKRAARGAIPILFIYLLFIYKLGSH